MPSMTTYSPYETLTLFQSVAKYGADASTFQQISASLAQNEYVQQDGHKNAERLSVAALKGLYEEHVKLERSRSDVAINGDGDNGERSPKRRKLSSSPQPTPAAEHVDHHLVQALVDRFYEKYKEEAVKDIKQDEETYLRLQAEIKLLESEIEAEKIRSRESPSIINGQSPVETDYKPTKANQTPDSTTPVLRTSDTSYKELGQSNKNVSPVQHSSQQNSTTPPKAQEGREPPLVPVVESNAQVTITNSQNKPIQQASNQANQSNDSSFKQSSQQSLPGSNHGSAQAQHVYPPAQALQNQGTTYVASNSQQRPSPVRTVPSQGHSPQGTAAPPHPNQHHYPPYTQYPPQWHYQMPHQQIQHHPGYVPAPYYPQPIQGRHPQTPQQVVYQPYPHTATVQYPSPHSWRGQNFSPYPVSAATTPIARAESRISVTRSGSTTPWRKKRDPSTIRPPSPTRPERAISPLDDTELETPNPKERTSEKGQGGTVKKAEDENPGLFPPVKRRGRPTSKTPSAIGVSRSQSIASHASDTATDKPGTARRGRRIKAEPPSTPIPPPSDSEQQRSSGRRGRPRANTAASQSDVPRTAKRKRNSPSPSPSMRSPITGSAPLPRKAENTLNHDPSLVVVTKNFSKTSQLLLNEITSHKLAGIFAKPLSERDAPGYKDLVLRPQDLKSVKAAISKGNRTALVAIEALESEGEDGDSIPTKETTTTSATYRTTPGSIGNGFYLVTKTPDLVPPKGIVNSSQLEMELMRMFANAIMFNPLPSSERGFGRSLRLRKNGGDLEPSRNRAQDSDPEDPADAEGNSIESSPSATTGGTGWDEGGIIADTREMFDDVVGMVGKWRRLEEERMAVPGGTTAGGSVAAIEFSRTGSIAATPSASGPGTTGRQNSVSASSAIADDDGEDDHNNTPVPAAATPNVGGTGTTRKRRKIAEH